MTPLPPALDDTLTLQHGVVSRGQLLAAGVSPEAIRWHTGRSWTWVLPGVILTHRGRLGEPERRMAALLYAGPRSVITGRAAVDHYGLRHGRDQRSEQIRLLVPHTSRARTVRWLRCERTTVDPRCWTVGGLRYASIARAVIDTARAAAGQEEATAVVIEAVQRRMVPLEVLAQVNDSLGRPGSRFATHAIAEAGRAAWSVPEATLARLVAACRDLPTMWCNPTLYDAGGRRLVSPDGWFDDVGLAVMVHSRAYHDGPGWVGTVERDADLTAAGVAVLPLAPVTIERDPRRALGLLRSALAAATARGGRPRVTAVRRETW